TETGENQSDPGNDGNEDYSSSSFALPESSETTLPESAESTEPTSTESSETPASESSGTTPESAETTTPSSTASTLTPLLDYELTQPFIDEGWRDECLRLANEYRATEGVAPLELADGEKQLCAINQAAADMADNKPHGHFGDCGEWAQNTGPNFSTSWRTNATGAVQYYIKMMWEEEKALVTSGQRDPDKKEDYSYIGHYLNMRKASYTKVACGIAISEDGTKGWFNMNFY
ncbi:MAG: CAP domain-containing protein, partial [Fibrobacter sp.]|nr:CAP domain-containing protein [Fibrobacter sp.]